MDERRNDSLRKRYLYKLSTNLAAIAMNLVTQAIIPRGLGPRAYGDFNFLTNFFSQVTGFLDSGTSAGFYTKLSCRPQDAGLIRFYFYFVGIASLTLLLLLLAATLTPLPPVLWPDQKIVYVYLAALFAILLWMSQVLNQMTDAYGLTVPSEVAKLAQKGLAVLLILPLFFMDQLHLASFFCYNYVLLLFLIVAFCCVIRRWRRSSPAGVHHPSAGTGDYARELYTYSHPLVIYSAVGLITNIFDRWLLQHFGGSLQQGFFGLSYQLSICGLLFTGAMTPLLMREFSVAHANGDTQGMASLFRRAIPLLYSLTAYFSCFIAFQADRVIYIFGGSGYREAIDAVRIMAFYPIHQTYGQLSGSLFYATAQTRLYAGIGILFMLLGLPVTYFLIAPRQYLGLDTGATGLALKMVCVQFVAVNVQLYFNTRLLNLSFPGYLGRQIASIGSMLALAAVATYGVNIVPYLHGEPVLGFIASGLLYSLMVFAVGWVSPTLFGVKKEDVIRLKDLLRGNSDRR